MTVRSVPACDTYFCVSCHHLIFTFAIIQSLFFSLYVTHHMNTDSSTIFLALEYSKSSTRYVYFKSFIATQLPLPYFHRTYTFHPPGVLTFLVDPDINWKVTWSLGMVSGNLWWSTISSINSCQYSSSSTCKNIFC